MAVLCLSGAALAQDARLEQLVAHHSYPMAFGDLSGEGGMLLLEAAGRADFVLVGESHGNRETPRLTSVLLRKLQSAGYGALALEVGPFAAEVLAELASEDEALEALAYLYSEQRWFAPFFGSRAEAELLVDALAGGYRVFGLDQEFMGSGPYYLERLRASGASAGAIELVDRWQKAGLGDGGERVFLSRATPDDFDDFDEAFAQAGPEPRRILAELRQSAAVYQLYNAGQNYESNRRRIRLLKTNLDRSLRVLTDTPSAKTKMVLKFGSDHTGRGYSALNQLDLGNHAAELGFASGGGSLHLLVLCAEQRQNDGSVLSFLEHSPQLEPLYAHMGAEGWTVVDLRALRPLFHDRERDELADVVWRHDLLLLTPQFHEPTSLVE